MTRRRAALAVVLALGMCVPSSAAPQPLSRALATLHVVDGVAPAPMPFLDGTIGVTVIGDSIAAGSTGDGANGLAGGNVAGLSTGNGARKYLGDWLAGPNETRGLSWFGSRWSGTAGLHHEGYPGETIGQLTARVQGGLLYGHEPQYAILVAGANDFGDARLRTWDQAIADMSALIDAVLAAAPWVRVVVCEQMPMRGDLTHDLTKSTWQQAAYNRALPGMVATKSGRAVVARTSVVSAGMLDGSGVHPTDIGYRWMAYAIYQALTPWLGHDVGDGQRYMTNIPVPGGSPRPFELDG